MKETKIGDDFEDLEYSKKYEWIWTSSYWYQSGSANGTVEKETQLYQTTQPCCKGYLHRHVSLIKRFCFPAFNAQMTKFLTKTEYKWDQHLGNKNKSVLTKSFFFFLKKDTIWCDSLATNSTTKM